MPDDNIDTDTLRVSVYQSSTTSEFSIYEKVTNVADIDGSSEVYFLQESRTGNYQIYFGNNFVGKKVPDGAVIVVSYLVTSGSLSNKANNFVATSVLVDSLSESLSNFVITPVSEAAGGSEKETVESIRYSAVNQYSSQDRLVTFNDYKSYILSNYLNLDSVSVWGGEDETPPVYGKVFISLKPKQNYFISETEKQRIIDDVIKPRAIVATDTVIRDPEFLYLKLVNEIQYNQNKTSLSQENFKNLVRSTVLNYFDTNVNKFESTFSLSKLQEDIINIERNSIIGVQSKVRLEKRFKPLLNVSKTYTINFNTELFRGTITNRLLSEEFDVFDNTGVRRRAQIEEVPEAFTGISEIQITNPGTGYTEPPTVTITGDGTGATAEAKIVNGKIESIAITNRGVNYSRALIKIEGGNGFGATAIAILDARYGSLRTFYYDEDANKQIVDSDAGTIDYNSGIITLTDLRVLSVNAADELIRLTIEAEKGIISSVKNTIISIDETDPASIVTELTEI